MVAHMDMDMGGHSDSHGPLSAAGVNLTDPDEASEFLEAILNDDQLKVIGNAYARYFWYGVATVVGVATIINIIRTLTLKAR